MKAYFLIKDALPPEKALVAIAHAPLAMYFKFEQHPDVIAWRNGVFKKVICKVNEAQFEQAKGFEDYVLLTESSLGGAEVALGFRPRAEWPKAFQYYSLYR